MIEEIPQYRDISEVEYYALEERAEVRHEYLDGEIFEMAGGRPEQARLIASVTAAIGTRLRGHRCYATSSDQRVKIERTGLITYPDLAIVCPPARYAPANAHTLLNPRAIVEVLSPTREDYDQTTKFEHYTRIESLTHYILIRQDRADVIHYHRDAGREWIRETHTARAASLMLQDLGLKVPVDEIYDRLDLPEAPQSVW
jgi:Uma2 family endonuclease